MILIDGKGLTVEKLHAIAIGAKVALCPRARKAMQHNSASAPSDAKVLEDKNRWLIGSEGLKSSNLAKDFILSHCAGVGELFPDNIVRGSMAARANVLATAVTGSRPLCVEKIIEMLNLKITPSVPSQGSVGAAGDLAPMAHIARVICGYKKHRDLKQPLQPTAKEALALINGVSVSAAIASIAVVRAERVFNAALIAAGMTMEALQAQTQCIDPRPLEKRGHDEVVEIGEELRGLLSGSKRALNHNRPNAFSIRSGPSVMATVLRAIRDAKTVVNKELNGTSDNPLLFDGQWIEAGNFHGSSLGLAMDQLKIALCQLATLSERRTFRLTHGQLSNGLPSFLVEGTGLNSGFMIAQYTAAALASEVKGFAHPASVDTIPTVQHHEDHVSMAPIAGRMTLKTIECLADIVGIELLLGAQAIDLRQREDGLKMPSRLQGVHNNIRRRVDFWEDDNVMHPAISALSEMVRTDAINGGYFSW